MVKRERGKWEGLMFHGGWAKTPTLLMSWEVTKSKVCEFYAPEHLKLWKKLE